MANERGRGKKQSESDKTMIQQGQGDAPESEATLDQTMLQGGKEEPVVPGDTLAQGSIEPTMVTGDEPTPRPAPKPKPKAASAKGQVFAGRFEVISRLGEGGMGVVYRARDKEIEGREIALKVLRPRFSRSTKFRELFFREIHAAQGFVSENVVQVRDTGKADDGTLFLTMDLVDGESLDAVLARESSLNGRHALEVARQTLLALASGHEQGFVHRDIKPSNIMLAARTAKTDDNPFGVAVRVLDFGIAGLTAQLEEGQVIGTPRYMSPEQVQGQRLDGRSDLFSVGIVLYEMLSGSRPFDGDTPDECRTAILETNFAPKITELGHLSEPIRKLLQKALQKDRGKRYQSAADFVHAIEKSSAFREKRGTPAWVGLVLMLALAGAGGLGWMVWDQRKQIDTAQTKLGEVRNTQALALDALRDQKQKELDALSERLEEMRSNFVAAQAARSTAELDVKKTNDAKEREAEQRRTLQQQLQNVQERLADTEKQLNALGRKELPEVAAARFFDHVVRLVEGGSPQEALNYMLTRRQQGQVDVAEGEGAAHLRQVLEAAAKLDVAAELLCGGSVQEVATSLPVEERTKALQDYQLGAQRLEEAKASTKAFELESIKWIAEKAELGNDDPIDRLADLRRVRAALDERASTVLVRIDEMGRELREVVQRERAELAKIGFREDPASLIRHLRAYPNDRAELVGLVDRLATETEAHCAPGGGRLDLERLVGSLAVPQWGSYLTGDGAELDSKGASTFRLLWVARRWYENEEVDLDGLSFLADAPQLTDGTPHVDWRAQLRLQVAFARELPTFFDDGRGAAVYRQRTERDGARAWYHEVMEQQEGRWKIVRRRIAEDGSAGRTQLIDVSVQNEALHIVDVPTLEVRSNGEHVSVALWRPKLIEALPEQGWARNMGHARFQRALEDGLPCLVFSAGRAEYWFSPGYGLVRHAVPGAFERELCYSARVR